MPNNNNKSSQELLNRILQKFSDKGFIADKKYSREKILNFLDIHGGKDFDRDVSNEIFHQCGINDFQNINLRSFSEKYVLAITTLREKLRNTKIEEDRLRTEYKMKQQEQIDLEGPEPLDNDLMDMFVKVVRGKDFENVGILNRISPMIYIKTGSGDGNLTQKTSPQENEANPFWGEDFEFLKISNAPSTYVEFKAFHYEKVKEPVLLGSKRVYLREFLDQQRRELNISFDTNNGHQLKSYKELQNQQISELKAHIQTVRGANEDYSDALVALYLPFPELHPKSSDPNIQQFDQRFATVRDTVKSSRTSNPNEVQRENPYEVWGVMMSKNPSIKATLYVSAIHMILTLLCSFERNMFFDQYLGLSLLGNIFIWMHVNMIFSYKLISGFVIQTLIDIWWIIVYMYHWWGTDYIDSRSLGKLRVVTIISTLLLFIVRIILIVMINKVGKIKIQVGEAHSLSNQYNKGVRNDDFFLRPEFSQDSSMMGEKGQRELGESMLVN